MSGVALGLVGIWCMHFIGNRAIILGSGDPKIQLVYDPGFSTLSVFLPIIGLCIAFSAAEYPIRSPYWKWLALVSTGVFAGLSIVGMHYLGNFGISNYKLEYRARFLAGSIIIAIGDSLAVMVLFYYLREKWISDWRKRTLCAVFLSAGVSAMHFTASTHCIYILRNYSKDSARHSRNLQVEIASALCGTAAFIILCVLLLSRHRSRVLKRSSRKVMLACAMFDPDGRVLVTTEGVLPSREITDKFNGRTFDDDFDQSHPVFHWIFRVSRNWSCVTDLIPRMRSHLGSNIPSGHTPPGSSSASAPPPQDASLNSSLLFRESFCVATASLALYLHMTLEKMGVLYDTIIETGTLPTERRPVKRQGIELVHMSKDLESGPGLKLFGSGQLLFLTRRLKADDVDRLLNIGLKFGSLQQVSRNIALSMQIPVAAVEDHLTNLKHYVDNLSTVQKPGVWLSCFAMIPKPHHKGFDIIVKSEDRSQLPDIQILTSAPLAWQFTFLEQLHEKTMAQCMSLLDTRQERDSPRTRQEQHFMSILRSAMDKLSKQVPLTWSQSARFYGKPVYAHYAPSLRSSKAGVSTLYSFVVYGDLHTSIQAYPGITRIPLSFFSVRHQCYHHSPNSLMLAREIHKEFGPLLARQSSGPVDRAKKTSVYSNKIAKSAAMAPRKQSLSQVSSDDKTDSGSSIYEFGSPDLDHHGAENANVYDSASPDPNAAAAERAGFWGGILVNSETFVNSDSTSEVGQEPASHAHVDTNAQTGLGLGVGLGSGTGMRVAVGTSRPEETFVDELCRFARAMVSSSRAGR